MKLVISLDLYVGYDMKLVWAWIWT